jgi:hypothetical protein
MQQAARATEETQMMDREPQVRPQLYARVGGLLYLYIIIGASFGELFVRNKLIVWRDPAATANNILGSEILFRAGLAAEMLTIVCDVALALILYVLLRPVNRNMALMGAFFRLTFDGIYGVTKLFEIAALVVLNGQGHLSALEPQQLQDLAYLSLRVHNLGYGASLLFFGFCCVFFGHLIYKSRYLPRLIGVLLAGAGYGYIVFSVGQMLAPVFAGKFLFPPLMLLAFVAEASLALWLLVKGVDVLKWNERG